MSAILPRAVGFGALWVVLAGWQPADLPAAVVAVAAATWVSLRLSPPGDGRLSWPALGALALRFPWQSLVAGVDVARRAFSPALPLDVGAVAYAPRLPPGPARDAFLAYASTLPGTIPVEDAGRVVIHCLDQSQPAAAQLAAEEARFMRVMGRRDA